MLCFLRTNQMKNLTPSFDVREFLCVNGLLAAVSFKGWRMSQGLPLERRLELCCFMLPV